MHLETREHWVAVVAKLLGYSQGLNKPEKSPTNPEVIIKPQWIK